MHAAPPNECYSDVKRGCIPSGNALVTDSKQYKRCRVIIEAKNIQLTGCIAMHRPENQFTARRLASIYRFVRHGCRSSFNGCQITAAC